MARAAELAHIGIYSRLAIGVGELWAMPHTIHNIMSIASSSICASLIIGQRRESAQLIRLHLNNLLMQRFKTLM